MKISAIDVHGRKAVVHYIDGRHDVYSRSEGEESVRLGINGSSVDGYWVKRPPREPEHRRYRSPGDVLRTSVGKYLLPDAMDRKTIDG